MFKKDFSRLWFLSDNAHIDVIRIRKPRDSLHTLNQNTNITCSYNLTEKQIIRAFAT